MKKTIIIIITTLIAWPSFSASWVGFTENGIHHASIGSEQNNQILLLCDAGINAPITSINFTIQNTVPMPGTQVMLKFSKAKPIYVMVDSEGGIGSNTRKESKQFIQIIEMLKSKNDVQIRLYNGETESFALNGATKAIGKDCITDYNRFQIAS